MPSAMAVASFGTSDYVMARPSCRALGAAVLPIVKRHHLFLFVDAHPQSPCYLFRLHHSPEAHPVAQVLLRRELLHQCAKAVYVRLPTP